jgi:hypothetical protein
MPRTSLFPHNHKPMQGKLETEDLLQRSGVNYISN